MTTDTNNTLSSTLTNHKTIKTFKVNIQLSADYVSTAKLIDLQYGIANLIGILEAQFKIELFSTSTDSTFQTDETRDAEKIEAEELKKRKSTSLKEEYSDKEPISIPNEEPVILSSSLKAKAFCPKISGPTYVLHYLKKNGASKTIEITEGILKMGYKTESSSPYNMVSQMLGKLRDNKEVKNVIGNKWSIT